MRWTDLTAATAVCAALLLSLAWPARAEAPVSIELVLAVDTSLSVDEVEYDLQMTGIADAFRTPEIIDLIGQWGGVAVTLFQWSGQVDRRYLIPWHLLHDPASVLAFAAKVERAEREPSRGFTAMGTALRFAIRQIAGNGFAGRELKIDISGDGRNNSGPLPSGPRQLASALGITINGLPILVDTYALDRYFQAKVIAGPGAFIEIATDYQDFARAFLRKLRRELTPLISRNDRAPTAPARQVHARRPSAPWSLGWLTRPWVRSRVAGGRSGVDDWTGRLMW